MLYGHRNNVEGYAAALREFDAELPALLSLLRTHDVLVVTADHGCDPTTPSTDHSREYVPLLIAGEPIRPGVMLGTRSTFADLGATLADLLEIEYGGEGTSMKQQLVAGT
jgi:phosphopentomutase